MKKLLTVVSLVMMIGTVAYAAASQGTITLQTEVAEIESVAFASDDDSQVALTFDSLATDTDLIDLGSLFLNSNAGGGFLLTFSNNSNSELANASGESALGYTLQVINGTGTTAGDNPLVAATQRTAVTFGSSYDFTNNVGSDVTVDKEFELYLLLDSSIDDASASLQAGVHSSVITIEIANQ